MDRPKQRRFILLAIAFLAGGALLLLGRHWSSMPEPVAHPTPEPTPAQIVSKVDRVERTRPAEATAPAASMTAASPAQRTKTGLHGRIVDAVTRKPVTEFTIKLARVEREEGGATQHEPIDRKFQSQTGRFAWEVGAGYWLGAIQAPGYQQFDLGEREFPSGKSTPELVVPLLRGDAVRGRVFDRSTGAGLPDAGVGFRMADALGEGRALPAYVRSQQDGSFTLDGVPAGDIVLTVGARSYAYRELRVTADERTQPIEVALSVGGTIKGVVRTLAGAPVKGDVYLDGPTNYLGESDEAGRFSYEHMRPGRYRVSAQNAAGSASLEFVLRQDERKEDIVLTVGGSGRSVRGVIRGLRPEHMRQAYLFLRTEPDGELFSTRPDARGAYSLAGVPPGRAAISAHGGGREFTKPVYRAFSSADGQYEIEGAPPGEYRLRADEDISRLVAIAGDAVLNIDIPSVQLVARVLEDGGAVPIIGADVYVRGSEPATARVRGYKKTDHFGQFSITGIEPGEIVLMVYKPGYEMHREKIAYSAPIPSKTITLRKSAGVDVRVAPGSGRFPRGFTLTLYIPDNDYEIDLWMPLDREGLCHVPAALAGTTFHIGRFSGEPIVIEEWDGQSFELP